MRSLQVKFDGVVKMLKRSTPLSSGKLHHYDVILCDWANSPYLGLKV